MEDKIRDAFYQSWVGEAKAALRLRIYAAKAEEDGFPQIAKLFRVISRSEEIHGERAFRILKEMKSTEENLKYSFESEVQVAGVAYERFLKLASEADDNVAATIFTNNRDVEDFHAKLYKEAMTDMMEERDPTYYICKLCGYPSDGVIPDVCPVCGAKKEQFFEFK